MATYSGMLPGVLAGDYPQEQMEIDLVRLTQAVGALLVTDPVAGVDVANKKVLFEKPSPDFFRFAIDWSWFST